MTKYIEINMDDWVGPPEYMQYEYPEDANHWEATLTPFETAEALDHDNFEYGGSKGMLAFMEDLKTRIFGNKGIFWVHLDWDFLEKAYVLANGHGNKSWNKKIYACLGRHLHQLDSYGCRPAVKQAKGELNEKV